MTIATTPSATVVSGGAAELAGLQPLATVRQRWPALLGAALTVAMIAGLARQLLDSGLRGLSDAVPTSPGFYAAFALLYMVPPLFDYLIFRRLWRLPGDGLVALMKKRIANDVLLGYSGEAYFYAWARARTTLVAAPFGAVKDVSILSAVAGNAVTLALVLLALPIGRGLLSADQFRAALGSAAIMMGTSLPFLLFSRRVFSLERGTLWWIFAIHCLRIVTGSFLLALAWHFAMPQVALGLWVFLSAGRLLVSRLPFVPNKDLLFANLTILLIGRDHMLSNLIAFSAAATLLIHVMLIAVFGVLHLLAARRAAA